MPGKRPATVTEYIKAAPSEGKSHITTLFEILKRVAPKAEHVLKWGHPFFIEPRFLFAFAAYKSHMSFTSSNDALEEYRDSLKDYEISKVGILKIPYNKPIPEAVIQKVAKAKLKLVKERTDSNFW